jgi:hypothetical protein
MKKEAENEMEDELRPEYDFAQMEGGIRGKYVAQAFPNDEAVNEALRLLIQIAQRQQNNNTVQ